MFPPTNCYFQGMVGTAKAAVTMKTAIAIPTFNTSGSLFWFHLPLKMGEDFSCK
jgi:hypothetical protein